MKNKWVIEDVVNAGAIWHRALDGDRGEVTTYCGKHLKMNRTNARTQDDRPSSRACPMCSGKATHA
jgi:hypothetical protein